MATYAEAKPFIDDAYADMKTALLGSLESIDQEDLGATAMSAIVTLMVDVITTMPASEDDKKQLLELTITRLSAAVAQRLDEKRSADEAPLADGSA